MKDLCFVLCFQKKKKNCRSSVSLGWSKKKKNQKKVLCGSSVLFLFLPLVESPSLPGCPWRPRVRLGFPRLAQRKPPSWQLYVHRRHTLVEDLRSHHLHAGHDLLLVAHQRHAEPLDVPENRRRTRCKS